MGYALRAERETVTATMQPEQKMAITPEKLKAKFRAEGMTFKAFADSNGYPYGEVVRVVNGISKARRGRGHQIAVQLGLKDSGAAA